MESFTVLCEIMRRHIVWSCMDYKVVGTVGFMCSFKGLYFILFFLYYFIERKFLSNSQSHDIALIQCKLDKQVL